jgi:Fe-S-cluster-containing dehydrogenase component
LFKNTPSEEAMSDISRRNFLKKAAASAGGLALAASAPRAAFASPKGAELATVLDIGRCIGCGACVEACRTINNFKFPKPQKPFPVMSPQDRVKVEDWSEKQNVDSRLTPYNWLFLQTVDVSYKGQDYLLNIPRRCMHCQNPPCANLCPFGAARKLDNGITVIHPEICFGGAKCRDVCPWKIPQRQTGVGLYLKVMPRFGGNGVLFKCDRCFDRIEKGKLPACIEICPEQIQHIGPREAMLEKAKAIAKEYDGFIYGDTQNGGTNTFYVSPVPFEVLDRALKEQAQPAPHLEPVENSMALSENLGKALLLAPLAGALAAGASIAGKLKKSQD